MNKNIKKYKKKKRLLEKVRETSAQSAWPWHIQLTNKTVSLSKSWGGRRPGLYQNGWGGNGKQRQQNQLNPLAGGSGSREQREFHPGGGRRRTTQFRYKIIGTTTQVFLHVPHNVVVVHMETFSFHIVYCIHSLQESIQYPPGGLLLYNAPTYSRRREYKS
jgi:hypothetical protein